MDKVSLDNRASLREQWRQVVVSRVGEAAWLSKAFKQDEELAFEWAAHRIKNANYFCLLNLSIHDTEEAAVSHLSVGQRKELIDVIGTLTEDRRLHLGGWARLLVDGDRDLFAYLLDKDIEIDLALGPLRGAPDEQWLQLAEEALEAGYTPQEIAQGAFHGLSGTYNGPLSEYWREREEAFRNLSPDKEGLQEAAQHGASIAERKAKQAEEREYKQKL
jgi:hypothetical protein